MIPLLWLPGMLPYFLANSVSGRMEGGYATGGGATPPSIPCVEAIFSQNYLVK